MKKRQVLQLLWGIATFIPGVWYLKPRSTGGTCSARYCYSVWLRHFVMSYKSGLNPFPRIVAELGPGDSIGVGLASLLTGCERYLAVDVVKYANAEQNLAILDEMVELFREKYPIPDESEFPRVRPLLDSYDFPDHLLTESRLQELLDPKRVERIRQAVLDNNNQPNSIIQYRVPWTRMEIIEKGTVDMIFSQAVLEHVDDLESTYQAMEHWLADNGYLSHTIDYKSHGYAAEWNGHWTFSPFLWRLIRGNRPYLINRATHSTHLSLLEKRNFRIVADVKTTTKSEIPRQRLASTHRNISDTDLVTSDAFVQAVKRM